MLLLVAIVFGLGFAHIMRRAQGRNGHILWIGAVNYLLACAGAGILWLLDPHGAFGRFEVIYGLVGGVGFVAGFLLLDVAIRMVGVSIAQCVGWLGVTLPVVASILIWNEHPNLSQWIGMGWMLLALVLLTPGETSNVGKRHRWKIPALLGLFLAEGLINISMKAYTMAAPLHSVHGQLIVLFGVAGTANAVLAFRRREPFTRSDLWHGLGMGLSNLGASAAFMLAIQRLSGPIVFPTFWAGTMAGTMALSVVLWKERYTARGYTGMATALLCALFINVDFVALVGRLFS